MELLVNLRPPTDPLHHRVGDVIVAMPDGHGWTRIEREREDWAIVRAPVLSSHADMLVRPAHNLAGEPVALRSHRIDLTRVPQFIEARRRGRLDKIVQATRVALERATVGALT